MTTWAELHKATYRFLETAAEEAFRRHAEDGSVTDITLAITNQYNEYDRHGMASEKHEQVFSVLDWPDELPLADINRVFRARPRYTHIERWMTMLMTSDDAPHAAFTTVHEVYDAAAAVINVGNVALAKVLAPMCKTWEGFARARLVETCASSGSAEGLAWLHELWPDQFNMDGYDNGPFQLAAENGHVAAIDWMSSTLAVKNAAIVNGFEAAAVNGHVPVLQLLLDRYGAERVMPQLDNCRAYRVAAARGHDNVVQWFEQTWPSGTTFNVRMQNDYAYRMAVKNGNTEAALQLRRRIHTHDAEPTGKRAKPST